MNNTEKLPNVADYELTYESKGTLFIFEDIVTDFYSPTGTIILCHDDINSAYIKKTTIQEMNDQGQRMSVQELEEIAHSLTDLISSTVSELPMYSKKEDFSKADAVHMIKILCDICAKYFYFDFSFWDETFNRSGSDSDAQKKVEIVQSNKNKFRTALEPVFFGDGFLPTLIKNSSKILNVPVEELNWYRSRELLLAFDGFRAQKSEIDNRKDYYLYYKNQVGELRFESGTEARKFVEKFLELDANTDPKIETIQGRTAHASSSIIRGKVHAIVRDYGNPKVLSENMESMEEGSILVSQTTDPELMPAIRKASAMVTDVGGMLSHSAITARELNIPCIIDTKFASKVLKTGDLVEVDTINSTVKLIKSHALT